jgi:triacylglycerol esterase/lipase EstA (alpha/beta hydrolase family)
VSAFHSIFLLSFSASLWIYGSQLFVTCTCRLSLQQALAPAFLESLSYALARFPRASLWVTGHSLGGALAMLAVADLKDNHAVRIEALYTYGPWHKITSFLSNREIAACLFRYHTRNHFHGK